MAISYQTLRAAAVRPRVEVAKSITEAKVAGRKTAFLCHSHLDNDLVEGFVAYVKEKGWTVYIDWKDSSLPKIPDRITAEKIRSKILSCDLFIFLATHNSVISRWCPWEIGFADGGKFGNDLLIVETTDERGNFYGNEYLKLYRKRDVATDGSLAVWVPNRTSGGVYASSL